MANSRIRKVYSRRQLSRLSDLQLALNKAAAKQVRRYNPSLPSRRELLARYATKYPPSNTPTSYSAARQSKIVRNIYGKLWSDLSRKLYKWATLTQAEFKAATPVDTGNLRDSVKILFFRKDKERGLISTAVGVDSYAVVHNMPRRRYSFKRHRFVQLPDYDYSPFVFGYSLSNIPGLTKGRAGSALGVTRTIASGRRGRAPGRKVTIEGKYGKTYEWMTYDRVYTWSKIAKKNLKKIIG